MRLMTNAALEAWLVAALVWPLMQVFMALAVVIVGAVAFRRIGT